MYCTEKNSRTEDASRTVGGGFWYRISLPYHRSLFFAQSAFENASRTVGGLFWHRTSIRYTRRPFSAPNTTNARKEESIAHTCFR